MKLEYLLFKNGYEPILADSGEQAVEMVKEKEPDLIISDILMPAMSGYEFCRQMKSFIKTRNTPLIFLSALSDTHDILKGLECGASNFLTRPCNDETLLKNIEQQLSVKTKPEGDEIYEVVNLEFEGKEYIISASKSKILEILVTTYETAITKNEDLAKAQGELKN
ncbi:MAG: response regulator, partial [Candidatus Stygibacter australis]|nr:response regulator [Candidatus Stygibacter australis]